MEFLLVVTSGYLIEVMSIAMVVALGLRFMAYQSNKRDQLYYATFTREIEKRVERDDIAKVELDDVEEYVESLLDDVSSSLPSRGLRLEKPRELSEEPESDQESEEEEAPARRIVSVREYAQGSQSLINSLKGETNAFKANQKPNFEQLAHRVMSKDRHWVKLHGLVSIDGVTRIIDVLPGIFIIIGIFGTFVGITSALPRIAEIDFNNISNSSSVLSVFVRDVSFAMHTSIAGIAFSLILSLLNTLFPISSVRNNTAREVEDCLEYLWYFVHGGRSERQQAEAFSEMVVLLENIDEKIDDPASDVISGRQGSREQVEAFSKMIHLLENIDNNFSKPASNEARPGSKNKEMSSSVKKGQSKSGGADDDLQQAG